MRLGKYISGRRCIIKSLIQRKMAFLIINGRPIFFAESKDIIPYIRKHGLLQLINLYRAHKGREIPISELKWGDEIEVHMVSRESGHPQVVMQAREYLDKMEKDPKMKDSEFELHPEYGNWMLELVPSKPYEKLSGKYLAEIDQVLSKRSEYVRSYLKPSGIQISSLPSFPLLGCGDYAQIPVDNNNIQGENKFSTSIFTEDSGINPHPRFPALTENIRNRRGRKVEIRVPMYQDTHTSSRRTHEEPFPGEIYMDSMAFGMGCCCLQVTYECSNVNHALYLHDQLHVLSPIVAALSAAAPIFKGKLADIDLRWTVVGQGQDDRTQDEMDPLSPNYISKSRYATMNHYISQHQYVRDSHLDGVSFPIKDQTMVDQLQDEGMGERLAYHLGTVMSRDPLVIFDEGIVVDDSTTTEHFENFQSSNWNSVRFKPPPSHTSDIGWRVELRTMDIQLTDFENAALIAFSGLLVNIINHFDLNFMVPISTVDANMDKAHKRNAITEQLFEVRTNIVGDGEKYKSNLLQESNYLKSSDSGDVGETTALLTLTQILEGEGSINYKGIIPLMEEYMTMNNYSPEHRRQIDKYIDLIRGRASGRYKTGAKFIRDLVLTHPEYKQDSVVTPNIAGHILDVTEDLAGDPDFDVGVYIAERVPHTLFEHLEQTTQGQTVVCPLHQTHDYQPLGLCLAMLDAENSGYHVHDGLLPYSVGFCQCLTHAI